MEKPEALVFDIDDTLVDTTHSYRESIIATAGHFGADIRQEDITRAKAAGDANNDWEVTRRLMKEKGVSVSLEEVIGVFESFYQGSSGEGGMKMKETLLVETSLLEKLKQRYMMAIVTGRPKKDATEVLVRLGISALFSAMATMDDGPLKPSPAPVLMVLEELNTSRAWMIGDTPDDMRSGIEARLFCVGVTAPADDKACARRALKEAGASLVLESLNDLNLLLS